MPTARLSEARINAFKPETSARDVRDTALKGFGVRITPSGRKRFFIHTQFDGKRIWRLIGEPGRMSLAEARDAARTALAAIRKGQPASMSPDDTLFETVAEEVFRRYSRHWKPSTPRVNRGYLPNQILPGSRGDRSRTSPSRMSGTGSCRSMRRLSPPTVRRRCCPLSWTRPRSTVAVRRTATRARVSGVIGARAVIACHRRQNGYGKQPRGNRRRCSPRSCTI